MFNITEHQWSHALIINATIQPKGNGYLNGGSLCLENVFQQHLVRINKDDAIAIAKHFYNQLQTIQERMEFFQAMSVDSKDSRVCTKRGTHLAYNAPEDSCLCGSDDNITYNPVYPSKRFNERLKKAQREYNLRLSQMAENTAFGAPKELIDFGYKHPTTKSFNSIPRPENTYRSLNLDSVGEIRRHD